MATTPDTTPDTATAQPPAGEPSTQPAPPALTGARAPEPRMYWPTVLVEGDADYVQAAALTLADEQRVGEVVWIDWSSGLGDQWTHGTRVRLLDRLKPESWETQLKMIDHVARHGREFLDATGTPIAVIVDSASAIYGEQRRWARQQTNSLPKYRHALREHPGLPVPIDGQMWDEIEERHIHLMQALAGVPGVTVVLATGSLRVTDSEGSALVVPDYRIDAHRQVPRLAHVRMHVDESGKAYARRLPPLWRHRLDTEAPTTIGEVVFDLLQLDPATATHHVGL
jgi:hypothetical protein